MITIKSESNHIESRLNVVSLSIISSHLCDFPILDACYTVFSKSFTTFSFWANDRLIATTNTLKIDDILNRLLLQLRHSHQQVTSPT